MNVLSEILSSRARADIFRLLFSGTGKELHIREIQRRSGLTNATLRSMLFDLRSLNVVRMIEEVSASNAEPPKSEA